MGLKRVSAKDVEIAQLRGSLATQQAMFDGLAIRFEDRGERIRELKDEVAELKLIINAKPLPFQDTLLVAEHEAAQAPANEFLERLAEAHFPSKPPPSTKWFGGPAPAVATEITPEEAAA